MKAALGKESSDKYLKMTSEFVFVESLLSSLHLLQCLPNSLDPAPIVPLILTKDGAQTLQSLHTSYTFVRYESDLATKIQVCSGLLVSTVHL
jgi:hypothetical protein